ncbi:MAG TPA: hypothetical protein VMT64_03460, partial [Candidatus Binataceae bacterium]|nr:hypothetical protein [Candidatus Binataceae bacterium]
MNHEQPSASRLDARRALYQTAPRWQELLAAVRAGQHDFAEDLEALGLLERYGLATSAVHAYEDIEAHAMILGIVSVPRWNEVRDKSYLTYASHWIDDFFDADGEASNFNQLFEHRGDIRAAMATMGPPGEVGFLMAKRARHPHAVYKALHRMLYGGLIQRCSERSRRAMLIDEYLRVAGQFVDRELAAEIASLRPEAYWATNKTVLELLAAAEERIDFDGAELWSILYAPALYFEDSDEERVRGELSFESDETPTLEDMLAMVRLARRRLRGPYQPTDLEHRQLGFLMRALPNLPARLVDEYQKIGGI